MTKLKALKTKIGLPIIIAIILALTTVGVLAAAAIDADRTIPIHITTEEPPVDTTGFLVVPTQESIDSMSINIAPNASTIIDFTIVNDGNTAITVISSCSTPATGITVTFSDVTGKVWTDQGTITLDANMGATGTIKAKFTAAADASGDLAPNIHFALPTT